MWQDFKLGELEAVLFAAGEPLGVPQLAEILQLTKPQIWDLLSRLEKTYEGEAHGLSLREIGGGYQLCTKEAFASAVKQLAVTKELKLTNAAMETLAIIAFKQPVTRGEMEAVRGVKVDGVVNTLLDYGLIAEAGRKDTIGKPILYATTPKFLLTFGLKSLADLPQLPEEVLAASKDPAEISLLDFAEDESAPATDEGTRDQTDNSEPPADTTETPSD